MGPEWAEINLDEALFFHNIIAPTNMQDGKYIEDKKGYHVKILKYRRSSQLQHPRQGKQPIEWFD